MNRDDIIRMAREAGLCDEEGRDSDSIVITSYLEHFAKLVAAAEREECAKVCENIATETYGMTNLREYGECAEAIRERGAP
jgi:hypothetical protein